LETLPSWENLLLGIFALILVFWMKPGIKAAMIKSQQAPKDWMGALIPLGLVVLFVMFLIMMV